MTCVLINLVLELIWDKLRSLIRSGQFPVMQQYERDTWYDIHGHIVFTNSSGLVGVGLTRKGARKEPPTNITTPAGTVIEQTVTDDTLPNGPHQKVRRYEAPFATASREDDYRTAWAFFLQPHDPNNGKSQS